MKKTKLMPFLITLGAVFVALGGANLRQAVGNDKIMNKVEAHNLARPEVAPERLVIPSGGVAISTAAEFKSHFNNDGASTGKSLYLTNDIDMNGVVLTEIGMHGEYSKIFEGNGFTVSNLTVGQLFHFIGASAEVRNINLRYIVRNSSAALCYQNNGTIDNVKIELTIDAVRDHIGGFSRIGGSGSVTNSQVDFIFEGDGVNSTTNLMAVSYQGALSTTNCSYYANVSGIVQGQGLTERTEPIEWEGALPPRVSVIAGYIDKIYVEEEPSSTEIQAEIQNSEETPTWSLVDLVGEAFGDVDFDDEDVIATITAKAKGTVSFKFKATIDGVDYLSSLVSIKVLNNSTDYDIPENAHEIKDKASFESFFQGSGVNNNKNAYLSADIDLEGKDFNLGMAGDYSGIFEGQGYTISNFTASRLFELTTSTMIIRNLNVVYTTKENIVGGAGLVYRNSGAIQNVRMTITVSQGVHTFGGFSLIGDGLFEDCHADFIVESTNSHTLYPISQDDHARNLVNCSWTFNGEDDSVMFIGGNVNKSRDLIREGALGLYILVMSYEGGDISTPECSAKWALALAKWEDIGPASREQVKTLAEFSDAWLRLQQWAVANNGSLDVVVEDARITANKNFNNLEAVLLIGFSGLTLTMLYYFLSKKKVRA